MTSAPLTDSPEDRRHSVFHNVAPLELAAEAIRRSAMRPYRKGSRYYSSGGRSMWTSGVRLTLPLLIVSLAGCASNPYAAFYRSNVADPAVSRFLERPAGPAQLFGGKDPDADSLAMLEDGYGLLGQSAFNGKVASRDSLLAHAKAVGASAVIVYVKYANTISGTTNLVLPAPPTRSSSTTQGMVGSTPFSATTQTTTTGALNTYSIPYSQDRYDQIATFWAKDLRPVTFGVYVRDLSFDERQQLGRNRGVTVLAVLKGSPAFTADILRGDVLVRIGSAATDDVEAFHRARDSNAGAEVDVECLRGGRPRTVRVKLKAQ